MITGGKRPSAGKGITVTTVSRSRSAAALATSCAAVAVAAGIGGVGTATGVRTWYPTLDRPSWRPPDQAFGPVWSVLYAANAVSAWLVWRANPSESRKPLTLYGAQLALNAAWPLLFFGLKRPGLALIEIALLWVAIAATVAAFARRRRTAALLLVPYLAWVTFALALNRELWRRNR
jgi:tryptophan-rich sensory protein